MSRGLTYKTVRVCVHACKSTKWRGEKNIQIYKTVRTHNCMQCSLYKSHSVWECVHMYQPHSLPSTFPYSTIKGQCKANKGMFVYRNEPADQWFFTVDQRKQFSSNRNRWACGWGGEHTLWILPFLKSSNNVRTAWVCASIMLHYAQVSLQY